jgi:hypothetical protein
MNDLSQGDYSVVVEAGPSYATRRQESADTLNQMVQAYPPLMQIAGDLLFKAQDIPDADALGDRMKMALIPPVQQMLAAKEQGQAPLPPQVQAQMQQMQQQLQQAGQAVQQLQAENQQLKSGEAAKAQLAQIQQQTDLQRESMIDARERYSIDQDNLTKLRIAEIQANAQLMSKAMVPPVTPVPDALPQ